MAKKNRKDQAELQKDRNTQALLRKFLSGEIAELKPAYDPEIGYHYPTVEAIVGASSGTQDFLNRLYEAGVLERRLYDKIFHCPECGSANISIHYNCPYCKSFDIEKSSLIEHIKCGYMDVRENFQKESKLVCPKCHGELKKLDFDYRQAGIWCTCRECSKSFDIPETAHFCRDCEADSTFEDAIVNNVYAFNLKEAVRSGTAAGWVVVDPVQELLREMGFEVESSAFLKGKSGANHMFDIVAYEGGPTRKVVVIDLASSVEDAVPEQPMIALFAKTFDVSPNAAYLIAIPRISENGRKMAELYNIGIVEGANEEEVISSLKSKLLGEE